MSKSENEIRSTQTKCKHIILDNYLKKWCGIIFLGLRHGKMTSVPRFVYVDCYSYKGIYTGGDCDVPNNKSVYGSPIIGIKALDELRNISIKQSYPIETYSILLEKDKSCYQTLLDTLSDLGYEDRIKTSNNFSNLNNNDILVLNEDSTEIIGELLLFTNRKDTWAFYLLDPFHSIPYDFVKPILRGKNHDVMINFIYERFIRDFGILFSDKATKQQQNIAENWKLMFEPAIWDNIFSTQLIDRISGKFLTPREKEKLFIESYYESLKSMDSGVSIKFIDLQYPNRKRTMLYLFLSTHDPTGALSLNKVLYDTKLLEHEIRHQARAIEPMRKGQLSLFELKSVIGKNKIPRPSKEDIASNIYNQFAGKETNLKEIYNHLTDTDFFAEEVKSSIRFLKNQCLCTYEGNKLTHRVKIRFNQN